MAAPHACFVASGAEDDADGQPSAESVTLAARINLCNTLALLFAERHATGDLQLVCRDGVESAHRLVLTLRSEYFRSLVSFGHDVGGDTLPSRVNLSGFTRPVLTLLLQYFYTGTVPARFSCLQDALGALQAAKHIMTEECCLLTAHAIASSGVVDSHEAAAALLDHVALCGPDGQYSTSVDRLLKLTAVARLLPIAALLEPEPLAVVLATLRQCTPRELFSLGLNSAAVDAAVDGPVTRAWRPGAQPRLRSPSGRQRVALCVLNLRPCAVVVKWISWEGDEWVYRKPQNRVNSEVCTGAYEMWSSVDGHMWRVYDAPQPPLAWWDATGPWVGGFTVRAGAKAQPLDILFGMSAFLGAGPARGGLHTAAARMRAAAVQVPLSAEQLIVIL